MSIKEINEAVERIRHEIMELNDLSMRYVSLYDELGIDYSMYDRERLIELAKSNDDLYRTKMNAIEEYRESFRRKLISDGYSEMVADSLAYSTFDGIW